MRRNFSLISVFSQGITNNLDELKLPSDSVLPHVRTDIVDYLKEGDGFTVERMQLNYFLKPFDDLYFKFSGGIFESMFGGYGFESLYRPFDKNFAIGLEAWRVKQREFKQRFGFRKYETTTGHMVFYYREPNTKVLLKLYGGKYLAGDSGITLDLSGGFTVECRLVYSPQKQISADVNSVKAHLIKVFIGGFQLIFSFRTTDARVLDGVLGL